MPPLKVAFAVVTLAPASSVCVPPPKSSVPAAPVKLPLLVPPPVSRRVPLCTSTAPALLNATVPLQNWTQTPAPPMLVVPVPTALRKVPLAVLLKVPTPVSPPTMASLDWTSQVPVLLIVVPASTRSRPALQVVAPAVFSVRVVRTLSPAPLRASVPLLTVLPVPLIVPPLHKVAPVAVSVPLPVNVPLDNVNVPLVLDGSDTVSAPPPIVMISVDCSLPVNCVPVLTVMTGLAAPRSINTIWPATGSPALQFDALLQSPPESVFQTFTPVNVVPRCRKTVLPTVCVTKASGPPGPVGGITVVNEPDTVPPAVTARKVSPTVVPVVVNGLR